MPRSPAKSLTSTVHSPPDTEIPTSHFRQGQEYTDPEHDPMIPHTLVCTLGLVIQSIYNGFWFWGCPSFYDSWRDLCHAASRDRGLTKIDAQVLSIAPGY